MKQQIYGMKPIGSIKPYPGNPRLNDEAVTAVANSIRAFGFRSPIVVDRKLVIIAGHTRLKAAERLGLKTVPVIVAGDLTPAQVRALRIADNKTGELATWDEEALAAELRQLGAMGVELSLTGFDEAELKSFLPPDFSPAAAEDQGRLDQKAKVKCPSCGNEF